MRIAGSLRRVSGGILNRHARSLDDLVESTTIKPDTSTSGQSLISIPWRSFITSVLSLQTGARPTRGSASCRLAKTGGMACELLPAQPESVVVKRPNDRGEPQGGTTTPYGISIIELKVPQLPRITPCITGNRSLGIRNDVAMVTGDRGLAETTLSQSVREMLRCRLDYCSAHIEYA